MTHHQTNFLPEQLSEPLPPHSGSETSKAAAKAIMPNVGTLEAIVLDYITSWTNGRTDEELEVAMAPRMKASTARARRIRLRDKGLVRDSGRKRTVSSGNKATVWVAVEVKP